MNRTALLAALVCVSLPAHATGDVDFMESARFICGTQTTLMFLKAHDHTGGGISHGVTWTWELLDIATGKVTSQPFGSVTYTPLDSRVDVPLKVDGSGAAKAFAGLGKIGCELYDARVKARPPAAWSREDWAIKGGAFEVTLTEQLFLGEARKFKRTLKPVWPSTLGDTSEYEGGSPLTDELPGNDRLTVLQLTAGYSLAFAAVDTLALRAARASLYNEVGLELHRAGHYALAIEWFTTSPTEQSSYNAACAWARLGEATRAVEWLSYYGNDVKKLAAKARKDRDFDRIRKSPELTAFLLQSTAADAGP